MKHLVPLLALLLLTACGQLLPPEAPGSAPRVDPASPTLTVRAAGVEAPRAPGSFAALPDWLAGVADADTAPEGARAALLEASFLEKPEDWQEADLNGDGEPEWIVRAQDPTVEPLAWGRPGNIFVVSPAAPTGVLHRGEPEEGGGASPSLLTVEDVTGDKNPDVLYDFTSCGANTCFQSYHLVSYHGDEAPRDLLAGGVDPTQAGALSVPSSQATVEERTGDGVADLVIVGGTMGSVGAGPQRASTQVWAWDGSAMALAESTYEASTLRYFRLLDANAAWDAGRTDEAITLYTEAATSETLEEGDYALTESTLSERDAIRLYAAFRLVLIERARDNLPAAQGWLRWLQSEYPDHPITGLAAQVAAQKALGQSPASLCAALAPALADAGSDITGPLAYMGYANPELTADTLCPVEAPH